MFFVFIMISSCLTAQQPYSEHKPLNGKQTIIPNGVKDSTKSSSGVCGRITHFFGYSLPHVGNTSCCDGGSRWCKDAEESNPSNEKEIFKNASPSASRPMTSNSSVPLLAGFYESSNDDRNYRRRRHGVVDLNASTDDEMNTSHEG